MCLILLAFTTGWSTLRADDDVSGLEELETLVDSIQNLELTLTASTEAGYYDADAVAAYEEVWEKAQAATEEDLTDEEYEEMAAELREALTTVLAAVNPVTDGYYYIVSGAFFYVESTDEDTYGDIVEVTKAMCDNGDGGLAWGTIDSTNAYYIWEVKQLEDGNYSVQNIGSQDYVYGTTYTDTQVPTSEDFEEEQILEGVGEGWFGFHSTMTTWSYHTGNHESGAGTSGSIMIWLDEYTSENRNIWMFCPVDDDDMVDSLKSEAISDATIEELQEVVDSANSLYNLCFAWDYDLESGLITNADDDDSACQFSSNAKERNEGSYAVLIDGEISTGFFHSEWSTGNCEAYHNLQVALNEPVESFVFRMWARENTIGNTPSKIRVFATNDETLGADAESDNDEWDEITYLLDDMPQDASEDWISPGVDLGGSYYYVRFVVEDTYSSDMNTHSGGIYPYFSLSEFQMYEATLNADSSSYNYISELGTLVDEMKALTDEAMESLEKSQASDSQIEELRAKVAEVRVIVETYDEFSSILETAYDYYINTEVGEDPGYTDEESQQALAAAIEEAETAIAALTSPVSYDDIATITNNLQAAIDDFIASMGIEIGKWYYIISGCSDEDYDGQYLYAASEMWDGDLWDGLVKIGGVDENGDVLESTLTDMRYMWRIVEDEDGSYVIQNRANSLTPCAWYGYYYAAMVDESSNYYDYQIEYVDDGIFEIFYESSDYTFYLTVYGAYGATVTYPYGETVYAYWRFSAVDIEESDDAYVTLPVLNNCISVRTYPFNIGTWGDGEYGIMDYNTNIYTYSVKSTTYDESSDVTTVELTLQDEFEAGEPFVLLVGDYANYAGYSLVDSSDTISVMLPVPTDYTTEPGTSNGLVGSFSYSYLTEVGAGYIYINYDEDDSALSFLVYTGEEEDDVYLSYNSGYFVSTTETGEGNTDLTLTFEGGELSSITSATVADEAEATTVNVYDLNGRLIKVGVGKSVATEGLQKGIYIVGGKKVIVK